VRCLVRYLATALLLAGCGDDGKTTRYGDADDVRAYRTALNPLIDEASAIESEVSEVVDPDGVSIDSRLNAVFVELRPRLLAVQEGLSRLPPPRKLQALHDEITQMEQLRLEGFDLVIDGFAAGDISLYPTAVERRQQADELIPAINVQLCEIDIVLGDRDDCSLLAQRSKVTYRVG
jgi:hypothetical protein